jgi:hypothetical protein
MLFPFPFCLAAAPLDPFEGAQSLPHPTIPPSLHWPGALVIGILGWFAMAAVIGIVVRANAPPDLLRRSSTHEPPQQEDLPEAPAENEE